MTKTVLVNKQNKIKTSYYKKADFIEIKDIENDTVLIDKKTYEAYSELRRFLSTKNINIDIASAFRSEELQLQVYEEFCELYGKEYADKTVAPVGTSEHHTGLAIDIGLIIDGQKIYNNDELMKLEDILLEIHSHLKDYGFILRYPKGKENITGYPYEPWHIRYVGKFVANIIEENNYTLEEYLTNYSGIILVNKKKGMTSFDVVNKISNLFGIKRIGHTGTLDPMAEGVLIVAIGKATKVVELLTATYKEYIATVKLGVKTDTLDITGNVIGEKEIPKLHNLESILNSFKKTYFQEVPIYSAVKVKGRKLYEYARKNEPVELPKKEVTIKEIELINKSENTFTFKTLVSKGCYIRSLINDIGEQLGTYATMTELLRTKQGDVKIEQTHTLEEIENNKFRMYEIDEVLNLKTVIASSDECKKIKTGRPLKNIWNIEDKVIFKDNNNQLLGIYEVNNQELKVWKNFV